MDQSSLEDNKDSNSMDREQTNKALTYALYICWSLGLLMVIWRIGAPQVQMSSGEDFFLYVFKPSSYIFFCFFSAVVALNFLLERFLGWSKIRCKAISVSLVILLSFGSSFFFSYSDFFIEITHEHIDINGYRRCDDGYKPGHKSSFHWVLVSKKLSDCNRLRVGVKSSLINDTRYEDYSATIKMLKYPIEVASTAPKESSTTESISTEESTAKSNPVPSPAPTSKPTPSPTPRPVFKMSHHFIYYGEGDVMISNFKYLPASVLKEIESVTKNEATEEYKKVDLTKYIPEMMKSFGLRRYKGVAYKKEFYFKFSKATLIHSLRKGDCTNYPDTFISLVSKDFKRTINGKEYIGYPDTDFTVMPKGTQKVIDEEKIKALNKKMIGIYNPNNPISDKPQYYSIDGKTYAFIGEMAMGVFYTVYDCTEKKCLKADYYVEYPACGT